MNLILKVVFKCRHCRRHESHSGQLISRYHNVAAAFAHQTSNRLCSLQITVIILLTDALPLMPSLQSRTSRSAQFIITEQPDYRLFIIWICKLCTLFLASKTSVTLLQCRYFLQEDTLRLRYVRSNTRNKWSGKMTYIECIRVHTWCVSDTVWNRSVCFRIRRDRNSLKCVHERTWRRAGTYRTRNAATTSSCRRQKSQLAHQQQYTISNKCVSVMYDVYVCACDICELAAVSVNYTYASSALHRTALAVPVMHSTLRLAVLDAVQVSATCCICCVCVIVCGCSIYRLYY